MRATLVLLAGISACVSAQSLTAPATPVAAGSTVNVILNSGPGYVTVIANSPIFMLRPEGDLITPRFAVWNDALIIVPPNTTTTQVVQVPAAGPGSAGSFVLYFPLANGAVTRLDVGASSPSFSAIHAFPRFVHSGFRSHAAGFSGTNPSPPAQWALGNTSPVAHTFASGDTLAIHSADATAVLATLPLAGITVPAGGVATISLPVAGLPAGPYLVQTAWNDPVTGPEVNRHGLHPLTGADLHFPDGKAIPFGGSITALLAMEVSGGIAPAYALAVGIQPGNTVLPGGSVLPLVFDALVLESLNSGLFGLLTGNTGTATESVIACFCPLGLHWFASPIGLLHPNIPALGGVQVRVAAVRFDPANGSYGASQGELITLQ